MKMAMAAWMVVGAMIYAAPLYAADEAISPALRQELGGVDEATLQSIGAFLREQRPVAVEVVLEETSPSAVAKPSVKPVPVAKPVVARAQKQDTRFAPPVFKPMPPASGHLAIAVKDQSGERRFERNSRSSGEPRVTYGAPAKPQPFQPPAHIAKSSPELRPMPPQPGTVKAARVTPVAVADIQKNSPTPPKPAAIKAAEADVKDEALSPSDDAMLAKATLVPITGDSALLPPSLPMKEARSSMDAEAMQLSAVAPAAGGQPSAETASSALKTVQKPADAADSFAGMASESQFTRNVINRQPVDKVSRATVADGKLVFFSQVTGMRGKTVLHRWLANGKQVDERRFPIASDDWRAWSQLWLKPQHVGDITVQVICDGKMVEQRQITVAAQ